jgi:hypothetical protein
MTPNGWALLALGIIGGVPLYALAAGFASRVLEGRVHELFFHNAKCAAWRSDRASDCNCGAHESAAWLWPLWAVVGLVFVAGRALLVIPARAAYRAALRKPECPGPDCGGCQ